MFNHPLVVLSLCLACATSEPVLRYSLSSCNSLTPVHVNENWQYPGGGDVMMDMDTDMVLFNSPTKSRDKSPPYNIHIEFSQYRRNREYTIRLETFEYYDSFLLQARGQEQADGNATLVGWFVTIPQIGKDLHCLGKRKSSVVDKGRPIRLGNLTFTWRAPPTDYGPIKFVASIVSGDEYTVVETEEVTFNTFPVSIRGCGREMSCFRACSTSPTCDPEESYFMVVMYLSGDKKEVVISLGGVVENETKFIAIGFGDNKQNLENMDLSACYKQGQNIKLGHYLVENKFGPPFLHRSSLRLTGSDVDRQDNFIWCQFRRPVRPDTIWDLDLSQPLFHFYFQGEKNGSMLIMPEVENIWNSGMRRNFTEITNDIMFSGGSNNSRSHSHIGPLVILAMTVLATVSRN